MIKTIPRNSPFPSVGNMDGYIVIALGTNVDFNIFVKYESEML